MPGMINRPTAPNPFSRILSAGGPHAAGTPGSLQEMLQQATGGAGGALTSTSPIPSSGGAGPLPEGVGPAQALADMPIRYVNMPPVQGAATLREVCKNT